MNKIYHRLIRISAQSLLLEMRSDLKTASEPRDQADRRQRKLNCRSLYTRNQAQVITCHQQLIPIVALNNLRLILSLDGTNQQLRSVSDCANFRARTDRVLHRGGINKWDICLNLGADLSTCHFVISSLRAVVNFGVGAGALDAVQLSGRGDHFVELHRNVRYCLSYRRAARSVQLVFKLERVRQTFPYIYIHAEYIFAHNARCQIRSIEYESTSR